MSRVVSGVYFEGEKGKIFWGSDNAPFWIDTGQWLSLDEMEQYRSKRDEMLRLFPVCLWTALRPPKPKNYKVTIFSYIGGASEILPEPRVEKQASFWALESAVTYIMKMGLDGWRNIVLETTGNTLEPVPFRNEKGI